MATHRVEVVQNVERGDLGSAADRWRPGRARVGCEIENWGYRRIQFVGPVGEGDHSRNALGGRSNAEV